MSTASRSFVAFVVGAALVLQFVSPAAADLVTQSLVYVDPSSGAQTDSGWSATYNNSQVDTIGVDQVNLPEGYLLIEIRKTFTLGPNVLTGQFPAILIDFVQRLPDVATVDTIRVNDEILRNETGVPWTDFHWQVMNHGEAWFDIPASGSFGLGQQFQSRTPPLGAPGTSTALDVFDGLVPHLGVYTPGLDDGDLVISTNLEGEDLLSFTFKEYPTPEPATVLLMGFGLVGIFVRRKK